MLRHQGVPPAPQSARPAFAPTPSSPGFGLGSGLGIALHVGAKAGPGSFDNPRPSPPIPFSSASSNGSTTTNGSGKLHGPLSPRLQTIPRSADGIFLPPPPPATLPGMVMHKADSSPALRQRFREEGRHTAEVGEGRMSDFVVGGRRDGAAHATREFELEMGMESPIVCAGFI
jgi:hypothetical protein